MARTWLVYIGGDEVARGTFYDILADFEEFKIKIPQTAHTIHWVKMCPEEVPHDKLTVGQQERMLKAMEYTERVAFNAFLLAKYRK